MLWAEDINAVVMPTITSLCPKPSSNSLFFFLETPAPFLGAVLCEACCQTNRTLECLGRLNQTVLLRLYLLKPGLKAALAFFG